MSIVVPAVAAALAAALWAVRPDARLEILVSPALLVLLAGLLAGLLLRVRSRYAARTAERIARAEAAAEQARRRFVGRLDHELKNPLTALLAALAAPDAATARTQAERIRRLLVDLRRVADVESAPLSLAPVDLHQLLTEAAELVEGDTGRSIRLSLPAAPRPLPPVPGDADLLLVAVHNVLSNAAKYSRAGDAIELRAREVTAPAHEVAVEIADSGPGIAAADLPLIWEELARGAGSAGIPGSGIGLALVRTILLRHGGRATVDSRPGAGTSVTLHLPVPPPA